MLANMGKSGVSRSILGECCWVSSVLGCGWGVVVADHVTCGGLRSISSVDRDESSVLARREVLVCCCRLRWAFEWPD